MESIEIEVQITGLPRQDSPAYRELAALILSTIEDVINSHQCALQEFMEWEAINEYLDPGFKIGSNQEGADNTERTSLQRAERNIQQTTGVAEVVHRIIGGQ